MIDSRLNKSRNEVGGVGQSVNMSTSVAGMEQSEGSTLSIKEKKKRCTSLSKTYYRAAAAISMPDSCKVRNNDIDWIDTNLGKEENNEHFNKQPKKTLFDYSRLARELLKRCKAVREQNGGLVIHGTRNKGFLATSTRAKTNYYVTNKFIV